MKEEVEEKGGEMVAGKVDDDRRMKNENRLYNDRKLVSR